MRFSRHEDNKPDKYFKNFETIHKGKRIIDKKTDHKRSVQAYIDYIVEKNEISQPVEGARSRFTI